MEQSWSSQHELRDGRQTPALLIFPNRRQGLDSGRLVCIAGTHELQCQEMGILATGQVYQTCTRSTRPYSFASSPPPSPGAHLAAQQEQQCRRGRASACPVGVCNTRHHPAISANNLSCEGSSARPRRVITSYHFPEYSVRWLGKARGWRSCGNFHLRYVS